MRRRLRDQKRGRRSPFSLSGGLLALAYLARDQWQTRVGTLEQDSLPIGTAVVVVVVAARLVVRARRAKPQTRHRPRSHERVRVFGATTDERQAR